MFNPYQDVFIDFSQMSISFIFSLHQVSRSDVFQFRFESVWSHSFSCEQHSFLSVESWFAYVKRHGSMPKMCTYVQNAIREYPYKPINLMSIAKLCKRGWIVYIWRRSQSLASPADGLIYTIQHLSTTSQNKLDDSNRFFWQFSRIVSILYS